MEPRQAEEFSTHWIFVEYYNEAEAAESVAQVEDWAKQFLDGWFEEEENKEYGPDEYLMYRVAQMTDLDELPEALAHEDEWVRDLACKRYMHLQYGWRRYKTWYIDTWNYLYHDNGETHGAFMAMCFKSDKRELHSLGKRVWEDLKKIQGCEEVDFDT